MAILVWDQVTEKIYETGTDHGVIYPQNNDGTYANGVAWNGLTAFTASPSGAEKTDLWADNIKYVSMRSAEDFGGTIEAYMYPDEFKPCIGEAEIAEGVNFGQQKRQAFGFVCRTVVGNDVQMNDYGYKLHICYGCTAGTSERAYQTINDSPEAITFSYEFSTTPVPITATGYTDMKPVSYITIDSTKFTETADQAKLQTLLDKLFGTANTEPQLPTPDWIITNFA